MNLIDMLESVTESKEGVMRKQGINNGFTLIELMVTLAIVAIVATLAVPDFRIFVQNNRLTAQNNALITAINTARSEAVKRRQTVTLCASTNGADCNTNNWELGWLVFVDLNANAAPDKVDDACTKDAAGEPVEDCILNTSGLLEGGNTLRSSSFANNDYIQYNSRGTLDSTGTFTLCDARGATEARAANINLSGRASQAVDDDNNSIVDDLNGADVSCP